MTLESVESSTILQFVHKNQEELKKDHPLNKRRKKVLNIVDLGDRGDSKIFDEKDAFVSTPSLIHKDQSFHLSMNKTILSIQKMQQNQTNLHLKPGQIIVEEEQLIKYEADIRNHISVQEQLQIYMEDIKFKKECEIKDILLKEHELQLLVETLNKDKFRLDELIILKDKELGKLKNNESLLHKEIEMLKLQYENEKTQLQKQVKQKYEEKIKSLKSDIQMFKSLFYQHSSQASQQNSSKHLKVTNSVEKSNNQIENQLQTFDAGNLEKSLIAPSVIVKPKHKKNSMSLKIGSLNNLKHFTQLFNDDNQHEQQKFQNQRQKSTNSQQQQSEADGTTCSTLPLKSSNLNFTMQKSYNNMIQDEGTNLVEENANKTEFLVRNYSQYMSANPKLKELIQNSKRVSMGKRKSSQQQNKSNERTMVVSATQGGQDFMTYRDMNITSNMGLTQRLMNKKSFDATHNKSQVQQFLMQNDSNKLEKFDSQVKLQKHKKTKSSFLNQQLIPGEPVQQPNIDEQRSNSRQNNAKNQQRNTNNNNVFKYNIQIPQIIKQNIVPPKQNMIDSQDFNTFSYDKEMNLFKSDFNTQEQSKQMPNSMFNTQDQRITLNNSNNQTHRQTNQFQPDQSLKLLQSKSLKIYCPRIYENYYQMERVQKSWKELKHEASKRTDVHNLIRGILEKDLKQPLNPHKPMLNLGLGEPSRANGFELPAIINEIMVDTVRAELSNGYTMGVGTEAARKAIVKKFSHPDFPFTENEVVLSFGCSGALYNSISAMCETGDNILVPRPGFPLCLPIAQNIGIELKFYDLLPEKGWEIDLDQLRSLVDDKTKAILVNNPSNPCGSCFSKKHCEDILQVANEVKVPIISDEVYYGLAYDHEVEFHSMGNLSKEVPVICVSSISKIYCLPGWRLGWSIAYNHHGYFDNVIANMQKHANVQLHPTSLVQTALPRILEEVQEDHFISLKSKLKEASDFAYEKISQIRGLSPIKASAAMYMMVKINMEEFADIEDDIDFCKKFLNEECTLIFPAQCFFASNGFRIVICQSKENIDEFAKRIGSFCSNHYKRQAVNADEQ
eukprot:403359972